MEKKEVLIYDLIFSEKVDYSIEIMDHIKDIYKYDSFIEDIKNILKKSKVAILKERIVVDLSSVIWEIKVKK